MSAVRDQQHVEMLKRTYELVGPIHSVIVDKTTGKTLSGDHRQFAVKDWPIMYKEPKTSLERELIVLFGNVQRQPSEEELKIRFRHLAEACAETEKIERSAVCAKLTELLSPGIYSQRRIEQLLDSQYKTLTGPSRKTETVSIPQSATLNVSIKKEASTLINGLHTMEQATDFTEIDFPAPDCRCKQCPNKNTCY